MPKSTAENAGNLRQELKRVLPSILHGGGGGDDSGGGGGRVVEVIDEAIRILGCLRKQELKTESEVSCSSESVSTAAASSPADVPKEFMCPLSMKIMGDPVIVASGQTYERLYIQKWLAECDRTCPKTKEVLSHTVLTPNHSIRDLILKWCQHNDVELPNPVSDTDGAVHELDRDHLDTLLQKISSSSVSDQKEAAKELRRLTKRAPSFRLFLLRERPDSIAQLLSPLSSSVSAVNSKPELQEDLITTLFNLSIPEKNKTLVTENPFAIPLLAKSLAHGTLMETRRNAAATFFSLSVTDSNKLIIGNSDALKPLMDLIEEGDSLAMKDAGAAVFNLCTVLENKEKAIQARAVPVLVEKIKDGVFVDASLSILALLSTHEQAVEEMVGLGFMSDLFSIIRKPSCSCPRTSENAVVIVFNICDQDRSRLKTVREEERQNRTMTYLAMQGTDRAKRKANSLLQKLKRISGAL